MPEPIVVAIPTFRRQGQLSALLSAVLPQAASVGADVLVVDNDPEQSAASICSELGVLYVAEPAAGLAAVRNRALDAAEGHAALVFIDDDEVPDADWLSRLVARWRDTGAAAVSGRVESLFPPEFDDPWVRDGGFFTRVRFEDGAVQSAAPTNNLLLDLEFVRREGLRFDERFGLTGGEDILFTSQLVRRGGRIISAPAAIVFDPVAPERLTRQWVLRRAYRVGISAVRVDLAVRPSLIRRIRWVAKGAARVAVGSARRVLGMVTRTPRHDARGARAVWRGAGMVAAAFGADYDEYARRR